MQWCAQKNPFIEVPFQCPLPLICPVCAAPAVRPRRISAWEGIPFVFSYHIYVCVPYCAAHYAKLKSCETWRNWAASGVFLFPFVSGLVAAANPRWAWVVYLGFSLCVLSLGFAVRLYWELRSCRGVQMRTLGNWPAYKMRGVLPEWNRILLDHVEEFNKMAERKSEPITGANAG
jgi:hypothetical protein